MSTNIKSNQVNDIIKNELKFDSINSLATNPVKGPLLIVTISLRDGKYSRKNLNSCLTCLWDSGSTASMIKCKNINPYKSNLRANKFKYRTTYGKYKATHDVKVPLIVT